MDAEVLSTGSDASPAPAETALSRRPRGDTGIGSPLSPGHVAAVGRFCVWGGGWRWSLGWGGQVLRMLGGSSAPASGRRCRRCFGCGGGGFFPPPPHPKSRFPRYFRCRSHKQREITKFNSRQRQNHRQTGLRCPVTAAVALPARGHACRRVHACAGVCRRVGVPFPVGTAGPLAAFPKPGGFWWLYSPPSPCQEPKVTGQGGDVPGWVSPSPIARPLGPRSRHPLQLALHVPRDGLAPS